MTSRSRTLMRPLFILVTAGAIVAGVLVAATASIPGPGGIIHACYDNVGGALNVIDSGASCGQDQTSLNWKQSGVLVLRPAPVRVYNSNTATKINVGQERVIDLGTGVPPGASAALVNLTVYGTVGSGYLAIRANGVAWAGTSNINWFGPNQTLANNATTAVNAGGEVKVRGGGTTHFIIDLIGYYP